MKAYIFVMALCCSFTSLLFAGDLDPSAPPSSGGTMKPLDQVEPRIPIWKIPVVLTSPGSYYLVRDFTCTALKGIDIQTNDITVDLCGYTISGSGSGAWYGVYGTNLNNIEIRNGTLQGFKGAGIFLNAGNSHNCRILDIRALNNEQYGIWAAGSTITPYIGGGHLIQRCLASQNGTSSSHYGIYVENHCVIDRCVADNNTGIGINAQAASVIKSCTVFKNSVYGIRGNHCTIQDNTVRFNGQGGIRSILSSVIRGNNVSLNTGPGIWVINGGLVQNNVVSENSDNSETSGDDGIGIIANVAVEVVGNTVSQNDGWGIQADFGSTVRNNTIYENNQLQDAASGGLRCDTGVRVEGNNLVANKRLNIYVTGEGSVLVNNSIRGLTSHLGIDFANALNFYKDNVSSGCSTNFNGSLPTGDRDGGGNVGW